MENLSFQYPNWYLLLCAFLGLGYALLLYFKDKTFREQSKKLNWALGAIRFLAVTFLSILLLSPILKSLLTETQKPVVVLAQDESASIAAQMDSTALQTYRTALNGLEKQLENQFEVKKYAFGNNVREGIGFRFEDKVTNLSEMLTTVYDLYNNQNLGAVILATDGIYNEGSNPIYSGTKISVPIYTIALGDTIPKKDLVLKRVFNNKIVYLGDKFSIQADVAAQNCSGSGTTLSVAKVENKKARKLQEMQIPIDKNDFFTTKEVVLEADKSGVQRYRIGLNRIAGEVTTANNSKDIFIDVLDAREKILLLANSPHPDISALKQSLEKNKNYDVTTAYINDLKVKIADFDFVVFHQLPSKSNDAAGVLNILNSHKIPRLFIVGTQTDLARFNQVQSLLNIQGEGRNTNEVQGYFAPELNLFTIGDELKNKLPNFPPVFSPFGEFTAAPNAQVVLYQRIGKVDTKYPLLLIGEENETKTGILAAEGLWKWRLFDFLQRQNHDIFEDLLSKNFQYATLKEDKRRFRISLNKNIFRENENIVFDAELYNESYELINEPDVSLTISNSDGKDFNFTFDKTSNGYTLDARIFPVGNYSFRGTVFYNGKTLTFEGQFSVQPIQLEVFETTADHGMLRLLSKQFGGQLFYPNQLPQLAQALNDENINPIIYATSKTRSVINLKWIFFVLLGLLSLEWFVRRYFGGY